MKTTRKRSASLSDASPTDASVASPAKRRRVAKRRLMEHLMNYKTNRGHAEIQKGSDDVMRVVDAQKKGSRYSQNYLTPLGTVIYTHLKQGGDEGVKKSYITTGDGTVTRENAKITATYVVGELSDEITAQQMEYVAFLETKIEELSQLMWKNDKNRGKVLANLRKRDASASDEDLEKLGYARFKTKLRTPIKRDGDSIRFTIDTKAYYKSGDAVEFVCFDRNNQRIEQLENIQSGAIMRLGMSVTTYSTPTGACGIKFRLDAKNNVLIRNGGGRTGPSETELAQWDRLPTFVYKNKSVYANSGRSTYMVRSPPLKIKYAIASNEGRTINGATIEASMAKYLGTFVQTDETKEFFYHMREKVCVSALKFMFDHPDILVEPTTAARELAQSRADDPSQLEEEAFAEFCMDAIIPVQEDKEGDTILKVTQRTTDRDGNDVTFTLVDTEGHDASAEGTPYELEDLGRGDTCSVVISASPWLLPNGSYGVSLKLSPNYPIHIVDRTQKQDGGDIAGADLSFLDTI